MSIFLWSRATATMVYIYIYYGISQDIKKTWSPALSLASRSEAPRNGLASRNEQRRSPTPICISYTSKCQYWSHWCKDTPMAVQQMKGMYKHTQGASTLLCFWQTIWNFLRISNRQNQSVVNAFIYVCPHPKLPASRPDSAWGQCKFIKVLSYGQCFWRKDIQL